MSEDLDNPNAKRYKTELIVIIALMVIVAVFIVVQVMHSFKEANTLYKSNLFFSPRIIGKIKNAKMTMGNLYFVGDQSGLTPNNE